jgi:hypothetical protein
LEKITNEIEKLEGPINANKTTTEFNTDICEAIPNVLAISEGFQLASDLSMSLETKACLKPTVEPGFGHCVTQISNLQNIEKGNPLYLPHAKTGSSTKTSNSYHIANNSTHSLGVSKQEWN